LSIDTRMNWLAVTIDADAKSAHALSDALLNAGALSVDLSDAAAGSAAEQAIYGEPSSPQEAVWPHARLTALFPEEADVRRALAQACAEAGLAAIEPRLIETVAEQDWVRKTQQQFTPVQISSRLWIVPSWHAAPDSGAINVVLDPGLAFGTGTHPTTQLVLRWLERTVRGGESLVDYGCGSGILAIAALKLGARIAHGIDVDPQALLAARHNAVQNQVQLHLAAGTDASIGPADIVVANILAHPLIVLGPLLARHARPGGMLALSGILADQAPEVLAAYQPWFEVALADRQEEWVLLSGVRR
jgi:ribosomal protein L11 methyltransferase